MRMILILIMKLIIFIAVLLNFPVIGHGNHAPKTAITGFSVLWNGIELWNHFHGIFGKNVCCHHGTKLYHVIELIGHSANLAEGSWKWVQENTPPLALTIGSLAFNSWGAWAQLDTLKSRQHQTYLSYLLSAASAIDVWGHIASALVAGSELMSYANGQNSETSHSHPEAETSESPGSHMGEAPLREPTPEQILYQLL